MEINSIPVLKRVAFIGNYLPRQCGIATFTTDLSDAFSEKFPDIQSMVLAMNDTLEGYNYSDKVRYEIRESNLFDYERAASFLNQRAVDAIPEHQVLAEIAVEVNVMIVVIRARALPRQPRVQAHARVIDDVEGQHVHEHHDHRHVVERDQEQRNERARLEEQELHRVHRGDHERGRGHVAVVPAVDVPEHDLGVERPVGVVRQPVHEHEHDVIARRDQLEELSRGR